MVLFLHHQQSNPLVFLFIFDTTTHKTQSVSSLRLFIHTASSNSLEDLNRSFLNFQL